MYREGIMVKCVCNFVHLTQHLAWKLVHNENVDRGVLKWLKVGKIMHLFDWFQQTFLCLKLLNRIRTLKTVMQTSYLYSKVDTYLHILKIHLFILESNTWIIALAVHNLISTLHDSRCSLMTMQNTFIFDFVVLCKDCIKLTLLLPKSFLWCEMILNEANG